MSYTAIILAGGKSLRFGADKTRMEINGAKIIETIVGKCKPLFSEMIIVGGGGFNIPGTREVPDVFQGAGPLGGIHAGLSAAVNDLCFVAACDMPNICVPLIEKLLSCSAEYDAVLPKTGNYLQPLFAVYRKCLLPNAEALLSQNINKVVRFFENAKVFYIEIQPSEYNSINDIFFNINYREDFEMYKESVPPVLSVVGFTDSGKTTYLEKLIPALKKRGIKLGAIKHDAHSFDMDIPGKDSWRLTQAGADITVVSSPEKIAIIEKWEHEENLSTLALRFKGKVDIILTEGYKRDKALKIEIRRAAKNREPFCKDEELFAIAGDYALETKTSVPLLPLDDAEPMADLIMSFLKKECQNDNT